MEALAFCVALVEVPSGTALLSAKLALALKPARTVVASHSVRQLPASSAF